MIPWRLYAGKIEIAKAYQGRDIIFRSDHAIEAKKLMKMLLAAHIITGMGVGLKAKSKSAAMQKQATVEPHIAKTAEAKMALSNELFAWFRAYRRAPLVNTKSIVFAYTSGLVNAVGALLYAVKHIKGSLKALVIAAPGRNLHREGVERTSAFVKASPAPTTGVDSTRKSVTVCGVDVATAQTSDGGVAAAAATLNGLDISSTSAAAYVVGVKSPTGHIAVMSSAYYPELIDGVLIIRKVYAATQNGDILEVE